MPHVLVVDDSPLDRRLIKRMLEGIGLQVTKACNGKQAVTIVAADLPDIIRFNATGNEITMVKQRTA